MPPTIHRESLLQLHLARHLFQDRSVARVVRNVDERWVTSGHIKRSIGGFNPFTSAIYTTEHNPAAEWLRAPHGSFRRINVADRAINNALFLVHDYLHVWAFHVIGALFPRLGFGRKKLSAANLDDFAFCHLVTEAAATVGLDFWYLSTFHLNERVPIGTRRGRSGLTTSYHLDDIDEFRRFNRSFDSETIGFFDRIASLYCEGALEGFSATDLKRSPCLFNWIDHEITYSERQRLYIRQWLAFMAGLPAVSSAVARRPLSISKKWQRDVVRAVGRELWRKVKEERFEEVPPPAGEPWQAPPDAFDARFVNVRDPRSLDRASHGVSPALDRILYAQIVSRYGFDDVSAARREALRLVRHHSERTVTVVLDLLSDAAVLPARADEPRDLFVLG